MRCVRLRHAPAQWLWMDDVEDSTSALSIFCERALNGRTMRIGWPRSCPASRSMTLRRTSRRTPRSTRARSRSKRRPRESGSSPWSSSATSAGCSRCREGRSSFDDTTASTAGGAPCGRDAHAQRHRPPAPTTQNHPRPSPTLARRGRREPRGGCRTVRGLRRRAGYCARCRRGARTRPLRALRTPHGGRARRSLPRAA